MLLSIVIPVYNEEEIVPLLLAGLCPIAGQLDPEHEIVFVDDGSSDRTYDLLLEAASQNPHLKVLSFSRNFGHQAAVTAGLDFAVGEAIVVMDADLQDPPDLLPEMMTLFRQGYDVVSPQRVVREGEPFLRRRIITLFYWFMRRAIDAPLRPEVGDFRLYSRAALDALRSLPEGHRFTRGLVAWLGLREAVVPFARKGRAAGVSKYPYWRLIHLSWTAITSFSAMPLRISLVLGLAVVGLDIAVMLYAVYARLVLKVNVPGWASLMVVQGLLSGVTLISVGLLGDYVGRIFEQGKHRPFYIVGKSWNVDLQGNTRPHGLIVGSRRPPHIS